MSTEVIIYKEDNNMIQKTSIIYIPSLSINKAKPEIKHIIIPQNHLRIIKPLPQVQAPDNVHKKQYRRRGE